MNPIRDKHTIRNDVTTTTPIYSWVNSLFNVQHYTIKKFPYEFLDHAWKKRMFRLATQPIICTWVFQHNSVTLNSVWLSVIVTSASTVLPAELPRARIFHAEVHLILSTRHPLQNYLCNEDSRLVVSLFIHLLMLREVISAPLEWIVVPCELLHPSSYRRPNLGRP